MSIKFGTRVLVQGAERADEHHWRRDDVYSHEAGEILYCGVRCVRRYYGLFNGGQARRRSLAPPISRRSSNKKDDAHAAKNGRSLGPMRGSSPHLLVEGDESSVPSAEALEVTACFVLFAELLRARRRRVRANARCARRRMPEAVPRNVPCSSATCHSHRMLSARTTPPPPTRPSPCATRGRARAGARGDLERMLGPEARAAAPRAHRRASAWAAFRRRRRHEGRGAQGQTRSSLARISSLIARVPVTES